MKITRLETIHAKPRFMFVRVHTDEGLIGLGEATLEGRTRVVESMIQHIGEYLVGRDPTRISHHWQVMYRGDFYRGGPVGCTAISGIEQALWDITGKACGQPVHRLLGGATRDRIAVYCGVGDNEDYLDNARQRLSTGQTVLKTGALGPARAVETVRYVDAMVEHVGKLRDLAGPDVGVAVDFHGRIGPALAHTLVHELEPLRPMFIEEPILPEHVDKLADLARRTHIPIATGERLFTKWAFREVLEKGAAVILQPDLSHAGGIMETRLIAGMAEASFASIAPHCPMGPVALAACLQVGACIPNLLVQEFFTLGEGYLKNPFKIVDGHVAVPTGPGLGVELDDAALADKVYEGTWRTPQWRLDDQSVADW